MIHAFSATVCPGSIPPKKNTETQEYNSNMTKNLCSGPFYENESDRNYHCVENKNTIVCRQSKIVISMKYVFLQSQYKTATVCQKLGTSDRQSQFFTFFFNSNF